MTRSDERAVLRRGAKAVADAWLMAYVPNAAESLVAREGGDEAMWSAAAEHDVETFVAGPIFDLDSLIARLGLPEDTATPARVALAAYRTLGEGCLESIKGRFVLLITDRSNGRLLAVRDRMGVHPLFYAETGGGCLLSPSIEALLSQPEVSRELNRVVLAEHMMHRWVDPTETYFAAVRRVPPGHLLEMRDGRADMRRYWNPRRESPLSDDEALERFDSVFERAVERTVGNDRAAIFLSGGFDSVSVAAAATAIARRNGRPDPHALSLGFMDPDCNEEFVQRGVAQSLGITQDVVSFEQAVNGRGVLVPALEIGATWPVPILNVWTPGYYDLARRARPRGCTTILTGTGGDEWLNVTPYLSADLIRRGELRQLVRLIGVFQRSFRLTKPQVLRTALWTFGLRPLAGEALDHVVPGLWQAERRRKLVRATHSWIAPDPSLRKEMDSRIERLMMPSRPGPGGFYDRELQRALDHPLVAMEYEEHFEFGRRAGVSMLHPYLDPDLVELLYGVSPASLTRGGRTKGLVRDAIARRFPKLGFEGQRKVNATNFFRGLLQREGPTAWKSMGGTPTLSELGLVQSAGFASVVRDLFAGRHPEHNYLIWSVLNLESWVRARVPSAVESRTS